MSRHLYHFLHQPRQEAGKKSLALRKSQFNEIYHPFSAADVGDQSQRCLDCGTPYCQWRCPVHNAIPDWLKLVADGRIIEAVELVHQTNSLPEICGRVCPQDRLCEQACTLNDEFGAVTIGEIERYLTESAFDQGWRPDLSLVKPLGRRVAVVGAGPAGLACADVLTRLGISVVVFDRHPEIGGLLTFGIPAFKLEKSLLARRRQLFSEMGIEFRLNCEIGRDISCEALMQQFDALFVATGTYHALEGGLPNEQAAGVYPALAYLSGITRHLLGHPPLPEAPWIDLRGKRVVVLGGGDTAMDCIRSAIRQGAASVHCLYRRDQAAMPGSRREFNNACEEGGEFLFNRQPVRIEVDSNGQVCAVTVVTTVPQGRQQLETVAGSEQTIAADAILLAFGFRPHALPWLEPFAVMRDQQGRIMADYAQGYPGQTSQSKIFAGGDIVRGADLVVTAIAQGRQAAEGIVSYLENQ
ncbi:MAG: FAD-dependent oxidoreductase [Enterobacteriaceae bacterium]